MIQKPQYIEDRARVEEKEAKKRNAESAKARGKQVSATRAKKKEENPRHYAVKKYSWRESMVPGHKEHQVLKKLAKALEFRIGALGDPKNMTDEQVFKFSLMAAILVTDDENTRMRAIHKGAELFIPKPGDKAGGDQDLTRLMRDFMQQEQRKRLKAREDAEKNREETGQTGTGR